MAALLGEDLIDASPPHIRASHTVFLNDRERLLVNAHSVTSQMIICGDCAGNKNNPRKTQLTKQGRCSDCGGGAYELVTAYLLNLRKPDEKQPTDTTIRHIQSLAISVGLIVLCEDGAGLDRTRYEQFLQTNFGVKSCVGMNATQRAEVVNRLRLLKAK